jgi:hypothetical protein
MDRLNKNLLVTQPLGDICSTDKNLKLKFGFSVILNSNNMVVNIIIYMVVNFRTYKINRGTCELLRTPALIKK